ncbi:hypothetical protein [Vibrio sp. 10N.261.55.A7]|uniref:hypothetical protein n=1 Tax=Vibrio sp. 10N.261.55.A7 TaxID=1880851 RepID=UPI000C838889|nr:hypothetical protein [Vibrio sp. 10N.261.55.A7]PMJ92840.1 hypothetical protein BCU12_06770 [Vibrio sp. 10N.261.55.A7]
MSVELLENAIHRPCPDMTCYSLNSEQKSKGLERLAKVKAQLKEDQLVNLRQERQQLQSAYAKTDSPREQSRITRLINIIDAKAIRISERWS